jgi:uncharacterized protein YbjT (DUF2867 family)
MRILVTGATGYVGGRLVPQLLEAGHQVRAMTRTKDWLRDVPWADRVEVVTADLLQPRTLDAAVEGIEVAYYLVHSIGAGARFDEHDRAAAAAFGAAAQRAGVRRIVYLGGLSDETAKLSKHLASRAEVGRILSRSGVDTIVLRAAMIIGSGSASFEMMRYLTERLPAMVTPKWVRTRIQPIAVRDVLRYLVGCAVLPPEAAGSYDIGGPDVLTYGEIIRRYAAVAGLSRRVVVPVPVLSLRLSSLWVGLVTPIPSRLARPLVESLRTEVVCRDTAITRWLPDPPGGLLGFDEAVRLALRKVREAQVETRWSESEWAGAPSDPLATDPAWAGGSLLVDERSRVVPVEPARAWPVVEGLGGDAGWYSWRWAWVVRGVLDRLVGGVGLRRGRRDPTRLRIGDAVDWWRVEEIVPESLLRLRAEMRVPGRAWLEFRVTPHPAGCRLTQRAVFYPRGLLGHLYWYAIAPFHAPVFGRMIKNLAAAASGERPG